MQEEFIALQEKVKQVLSKAVAQNTITPKKLLMILEILSKAENFRQLHAWIEIFAEDFFALNEVIHEEKKVLKTDFENIVKEFISELIKKDPLKAAEVSKSALQKDMTAEKLALFSPDFAEFIKNKNKI